MVSLPRVHSTARTPDLSSTQPGKFPSQTGEVREKPASLPHECTVCPCIILPLHTFSGSPSSSCFLAPFFQAFSPELCEIQLSVWEGAEG